MPAARPRTVASCALDDREARHLWNWLLCRQGLADVSRYDSIVKLAHASLGLHAARLSSPFATVLARSQTPGVALGLRSEAVQRELITVRCMRKTLHALPLPLAAAAHAATRHFRERDALRGLVNADVSVAATARVSTALFHLLEQDGPLFYRDIEARLVGSRTSTTSVRLVLKLEWERGTLAYRNQAGGWNRERRVFGLTSQLYPGLDTDLDKEQATHLLMDAYFDRYGPATLRDVTWWSGLSAQSVTAALDALGHPLVEVRTPWCDAPLYMYGDRFEQFRTRAPGEHETGLNFLAHEDVALKAYFESRRRYLGETPASSAFNQIGEVLPTMIDNGRVIGVWGWDVKRSAVTWTVLPEHRSPELNKVVRRRAHMLGEALRAGLAN